MSDLRERIIAEVLNLPGYSREDAAELADALIRELGWHVDRLPGRTCDDPAHRRYVTDWEAE
jgi:hypothetical protein